MTDSLAEIISCYQGSSGDATKALYDRLGEIPMQGPLAINLFRAQKASERAKVYRGGNARGRYRTQAYDKKQWAMNNLCAALETAAPQIGIVWGWGIDEKQAYHGHVLYIDLPTGQVSFHTAARGSGPDYPGAWDGMPGQSADRILRWVARVLDAVQATA